MATSRRQFLERSLGVFAFSVLATSSFGLAARSAFAAKKEKAAGANEVPADDAVASAIGYVPDASKVDAKANPTFKKGQNCSSCALFTKSNEGWGKCQMIQSGLVHSNGWCRSYNKKA
ncbi:MAG: high-potential iron-sulfur protein [Bdellovibrionales bacterium]|nr:high-potential iron-sulfur protein [Bdellovibrionales bacterium]